MNKNLRAEFSQMTWISRNRMNLKLAGFVILTFFLATFASTVSSDPVKEGEDQASPSMGPGPDLVLRAAIASSHKEAKVEFPELTEEPGLFITPDKSATFVDINPDTSSRDAVDPDGASGGRCNGLGSVAGSATIFYVATEWGGIYKTTDAGLTWTHLAGHLPQVTWDVKVDPANANNVYATSFYDGRVNSISGIEVSHNAGA